MNPVRRLLLALVFAILPAQLAAAPTPPATDWSKTTIRTASGAFVQGNPQARIRLVEYLSLTCPHCAHFEGEAIAPLTAKYIRTGLVSYEVRHALRDSFDIAGSLLARCDGPQSFFTELPRIFAQQDAWFGRAQAWSSVEQAGGLPPDQLLPKVARGAGFDTVLGISQAKMDSCLANHDEQAVLTAMASEAWRRPNFPGTPTFMLNDILKPDIRTWADLDAALGAALHPGAPTRNPKVSPRKNVRR